MSYAGRLHDLGKLGVPERTLAWPGPLDAAQWHSGRNWATRYTYGWLTDLGVYRLGGTVRYRAANA